MSNKFQIFKHLSMILFCICMQSCAAPGSTAQTPQKTAANHKKCLDFSKWKNPTLVISVSGDVTLSWHQNKRTATLKAEDLRQYLQKIPLSDWPCGRIISVSRCALQSGSADDCERGYQRTLQLVNKALKELDIKARFVPCA